MWNKGNKSKVNSMADYTDKIMFLTNEKFDYEQTRDESLVERNQERQMTGSWSIITNHIRVCMFRQTNLPRKPT